MHYQIHTIPLRTLRLCEIFLKDASLRAILNGIHKTLLHPMKYNQTHRKSKTIA